MRHLFQAPASRPDGTRHRAARRVVAAAATVTLVVGVAAAAQAATKVTVTNPGGLTVVGPVNPENGFPAYYQDKTGTRVEPCLDGDNALCGFLPGDVPDPTQPISFPDNWPAEFFYQLVDSSLTLPGGGKVTLTLGLEASFANGDPVSGDQLTFARTRVVVVGGPANTTLTFKHPFGDLTVDTDGTGKGRLVQDIAPAAGNFATALKSNFGPFLKWDPSVAPAAPAGYLGDPGQTHKVVGGLNNNTFSAFGADGAQLATTDLFGVSGKIATNTGVTADHAEVNGNYLDVFATSAGTQIQVDGVSGSYATTPMTHDDGSSLHYARIALNGAAPTSVKVTNLADRPMATSTIKVSDVKVTRASYDGTALTVQADSTAFPVTIAGVGQLNDNSPQTFVMAAPPATVTATSKSGGSTTVPVTIGGGDVTPPALPTTTPAPDPGPINDNTPDNPSQPPTVSAPVASVAAPAATLPGGSVTLDASSSTGATSYVWEQISGPAGITLTNPTSAKPTVTLPYFTSISATQPAAAWSAISFKVTATNVAGSSSQTVTIPLKTDALTLTGRHKLGTELRVDGTSLVDGQVLTATPQTQVNIYKVTGTGASTTYTKITFAPVDTLGAFALRQKPGPTAQVTARSVGGGGGGRRPPAPPGPRQHPRGLHETSSTATGQPLRLACSCLTHP